MTGIQFDVLVAVFCVGVTINFCVVFGRLSKDTTKQRKQQQGKEEL